MTSIFSSETWDQVACWGRRREPPWERWKGHLVMLKAQRKLETWHSLWAVVFSKGSLQSPWRREEDIWMHPGVKLFQGQHNGKKRSKDILGTWQGLVEALDHGVLPEEWRQQGTDGRRRRWKGSGCDSKMATWSIFVVMGIVCILTAALVVPWLA